MASSVVSVKVSVRQTINEIHLEAFIDRSLTQKDESLNWPSSLIGRIKMALRNQLHVLLRLPNSTYSRINCCDLNTLHFCRVELDLSHFSDFGPKYRRPRLEFGKGSIRFHEATEYVPIPAGGRHWQDHADVISSSCQGTHLLELCRHDAGDGVRAPDSVTFR